MNDPITITITPLELLMVIFLAPFLHGIGANLFDHFAAWWRRPRRRR